MVSNNNNPLIDNANIEWRKSYWYYALFTNISLSLFLGLFMVLVSKGQTHFYQNAFGWTYTGISVLIIGLLIYLYFFKALSDYRVNFRYIKKTKMNSLVNGLIFNSLGWLLYVLSTTITLIILKESSSYQQAKIGLISPNSFLGIFFGINIVLSISGFLCWTHFLFFMSVDIYVSKNNIKNPYDK